MRSITNIYSLSGAFQFQDVIKSCGLFITVSYHMSVSDSGKDKNTTREKVIDNIGHSIYKILLENSADIGI